MSDGQESAPADAFQGADRGISPISGRAGLGRRGQVLGVTALAAFGGLFFLATGRHPAATAAPVLAPVRQVVPFEPAATPAPVGPLPAAGSQPAAASAGGATPPTASAGPQVPALATMAATPGPGPVLAYSREAAPEAPTPPRLQPTAVADPIPTVRAHRLADRSFSILAGATLPCVLLTAIDSSTPGPVSCLIPRDVYADDAHIVLLEKGTRVTGDYVGLKSGDQRLVVRWTRAVTPGGVAIALASPAGDPEGRAGLDGARNDHLIRQFGGAVLMSLIEGAASAIGRHAGTLSLSLPSRSAEIALRSGLQVAPTLRKPAGSEIAVLVTQDLDFADVYGVAAAR